VSAKPLDELVADLGHVGELNRLLSVFATRHKTKVGRSELLELTSQTAGAGHRYPSPRSALELAVAIGLIRKSGNLFRLTTTANQFIENRPESLIDLSLPQGQLILGLLLDDSKIRRNVAHLVSYFKEGSARILSLRAASLDQAPLVATAKLLQQLQCLSYDDAFLILRPEVESLLSDLVATHAVLTEEALWKRLESQRQRARQIEEAVLGEEKRRLSDAGREDLSEAVYRISAVNVSAGYDIESFEVDGSPRYIEVKSSVGNLLRFEWSAKERQVAKRLREQYWVYFVPRAHLLPTGFCPILLVQDPIARVRAGRLREEPSSWTVYDNSSVVVDARFELSLDRRMAQW
jgi:hypothetical protein